MVKEAACRVCGDPVDETNSANCMSCDQPFHLQLRIDSEGKDCGNVWLSDPYQALAFGCFICLGEEDNEPPVAQMH